MNFLEELVAQWYRYTGHFVRTNVKFGKRAKGGWGGEMDVLAYLPQQGNISHIETSMDAESWAERRARFGRKFDVPDRVYRELFPAGYKYLERIAVVGMAQEKTATVLGPGIHVYTVPTMVRMIVEGLGTKHPMSEAVPEGYPLLRALQFGAAFGGSRRPAAPKRARR